MARLALLSSVTLLLLGFTWAAEDNPSPDPDLYEVAASRREVVVARQLLDPHDATTEGTKGQLQGRRRRLGTRRRRPLDPERLRQLLLRRQRLGLPLRRRQRPLLKAGESLSTTTTTQAPLTSTSTSTSISSSFSSSSISSSSSSSTTLRSIFPSFSVASRIRPGAERRPGWGNKNPPEEKPKNENQEEKVETGEELSEAEEHGDLKDRRRGVSKILKRPLHRRLIPALAPTLVTTPSPTRRDRNERFRLHSFRTSGKRVRGERRKPTLPTRPRSSPSSSSFTTPIPTTPIPTTTPTPSTTTTTTAAPTSSLSPPPTSSTDSPLLHPDSHPLLGHLDSPNSRHDSSETLHIDSSTPHTKSSTFNQDSLVVFHDSLDIFEPDSPSFDYDYDPPTVLPDSSVFGGPDGFPPPPPTFLPAPRPAPAPSKPRHTPVPKKVTIGPQPLFLQHPKFRAIRRFKPETQEPKIVPKPKYIPSDSRPTPPIFIQSNPSRVTHEPDHEMHGDSNSFVTQRPRHFQTFPSYLKQQDSFEEEDGQRHIDAFPGHVANQDDIKLAEVTHFDPFSSFASQKTLSHPEADQFDAFPSYVPQVTPEPSYVTQRNYVPEEPNFHNRSPSHEPNREVLQSRRFRPSPRDHIREPPARATTARAAARQLDSFHSLRRTNPRADFLLHDSESVFAPHAGLDDGTDPLYHTEVIYTPDQGDRSYDEADASLYADEEVQFEDYYEDDFEDKPGVLDHYKYGYQVESKDTGNFQERYEARDGATVSGSYKVALPDGRIQLVTYVADDGGFRAQVSYEGEEATHAAAPTPVLAPSPAPPPPPPPAIETPPVAPFPISSSRRRRPAPRRPQPPRLPAAKKNLRFTEHVTTASPNPFRLVVEGGRASTHAPPTPTTTPRPTPVNSRPPTSITPRPSNSRRQQFPATTNAHTIAPPHILTHAHGPSPSTTTTTASPHTPTPRYEYDSLPNMRTILYTPTTDATAYIHTLGRSHAVPVLLPLPATHPRTYFLNHAHDREGDSVEIQRGDASRPRISIHTPSPYQTDIYPSPRPPIYRFA